MSKMIFVNLAVSDVAAATEFYKAIGCVPDTRLCNGPEAAMLTWSDSIHFMLLDKAHYATFTTKQIADSRTTSEVLLCLSQPDRDAVDTITEKALAAGGTEPRPVQDYGFMYGRAFEDLDGHVFEPMWMDVDAALSAMSAPQTEAA